MINEIAELSLGLLSARRALENLRNIQILHDLIWSQDSRSWVLHCRLSVETPPESRVPASTDWFVLIEPDYPAGSIRFYPAKDNGICDTFRHQDHNAVGNQSLPWRTGKLCLDTTARSLGRHQYDLEPFEEKKRLLWHFNRALCWLTLAASRQLIVPGEYFELPQFPSDPNMKVVFAEDSDSFDVWETCEHYAGTIDLLSTDCGILYITCFYSSTGRVLYKPRWGKCLEVIGQESFRGAWIRLKCIPVLEPWRAPMTFGELRQVASQQGVNIDDLLGDAMSSIRDGKVHFAVMGFPIPYKQGEAPSCVHWQAFRPPIMSWGKHTRRGFRPKEPGYRQRDRLEILKDDISLSWQRSQNWHAEQLATRGRLPSSLTEKSILLIGAGTLGSVVAELLARGGVQKMLILDYDTLEAGNLSRHSLTMDCINASKASEMARRLNITSPHAVVTALDSAFPPTSEDDRQQCRQCDIVLDCTGCDEVIHHLEKFSWAGDKLFLSASMGFGARRLFCYATYGDVFPSLDFRTKLYPWLRLEIDELDGQELPWAGIGCWHPVFPARADDVWLMGATVVKVLERLVLETPEEPQLIVFEQVLHGNQFAGIRPAHAIPLAQQNDR